MIRKIETLKRIYNENPSQLLPANWIRLLRNDKRYERGCPWVRFSAQDWVNLIIEIPSYHRRCPWGMLSADDWCKLLSKNVEYASFVDQHMWRELLRKYPWYAELCDWKIFDASNWLKLYEIKDDFVVVIKSSDGEEEMVFDQMKKISKKLWEALFEVRYRVSLFASEEACEAKKPKLRRKKKEGDLFDWMRQLQDHKK